MIDRRLVLGGALALGAAPGLAFAQAPGVGDATVSATARLKARPGTPSQPPLPAGQHVLGLDRARDAHLFVPAGLDPAKPAPLIVMFHGRS